MGKREQTSPRRPVPCGLPKCESMIWFREVVSQAGGKPRLMPLDARPADDGNVAAHPDRDWEPARIIKPGEQLRDGERRWHTHFETCASPDAFRKRAKPAARPRPVREPGQPAQPSLFPTETTP
jgi:hypothetical protein